MKFTNVHMFMIGFIALLLGLVVYNTPYGKEGLLVRVGGSGEGFHSGSDAPVCGICRNKNPCGCGKSNGSSGSSRSNGSNGSSRSNLVSDQKPAPIAPCPRVVEPDLSKYILKSQIPPSKTSATPDMTNYMLKTECPPVPDLSKYVLKSSIPKPEPVIIDNSGCKKDSGECPPCPRPRCPVVTCPPPTKCPPPAPCPRQVCPPTVVKCKSEESSGSTVRPFLAPLNMGGFGSA